MKETDSGVFKCIDCGTKENIVFTEDGDPVCTDCLYEREPHDEREW